MNLVFRRESVILWGMMDFFYSDITRGDEAIRETKDDACWYIILRGQTCGIAYA